ncbi:MAG TPA: GAF domain-containing protein [Nitrosopumilaceae archaeon]|nr:GAF domain-containing protein [Nitrosopumilaceae archaeon]
MVEGEKDLTANLANISSAVKYAMNFFWVGFYIVKKGELVLGPFQGPVACTRIAIGKGVCGMAWKNKETIIVENVEDFPGHISCNSLSKSEIVLPIFDKDKNVIAVLDIDDDKLATFNNTDKTFLSDIISEVETLFQLNIN